MMSRKKTERLANNAGALLDRRKVAEKLYISVRTLDRYVREGLFPQPDVRIGERCVRWQQKTVDKYIEQGGVRP